MRHVAPLSPVASLDCAYFPSPRGCTLRASDLSAFAASPIGSSLCFHKLTNLFSRNSLVFTSIQNPRSGGPCSGGSRFLLLATRHSALATRIGSGALQDGAQLADVLKTFDAQDFLDHSVGGGRPK